MKNTYLNNLGFKKDSFASYRLEYQNNIYIITKNKNGANDLSYINQNFDYIDLFNNVSLKSIEIYFRNKDKVKNEQSILYTLLCAKHLLKKDN